MAVALDPGNYLTLKHFQFLKAQSQFSKYQFG